MKNLWLVVLLAACPPPPGDCRLATVLPAAPGSLLATAGTAQTFSFVFTGPACRLPDGSLSARPLLTTPAGTTVPVEVPRLVQLGEPDFFQSTIELDLAIPPLAAGTHFLQLFVEPTLGVFQMPVFVATDRRANAGSVVSLPEPCLRPARTTAGTQFCARGDAGFIAFRDGRSTFWPGVDRLLTAGNVAWLVGRPDLRRYEDQPDGGLLLTATATLLTVGAGGAADEMSAIIGSSRYDFDGGVLERRSVGSVSGARWPEGERTLGVTPGSICDDRRCVQSADGARFLGLDSAFLWLVTDLPTAGTSTLTFPSSIAGGEQFTVRILKRPVAPDAGDAFAFAVPPGFQPDPRTVLEVSAGFPPMLFSTPDAGPRRMVLLTQGRDGTTFDVFPPDVVGASRDFLFLAGTTTRELRVVPLPLTP